MRTFILFCALIIASLPLLSAAGRGGVEACKKGHRGVLFHIRDRGDISKGCKVTVILRKNCIKLLR